MKIAPIKDIDTRFMVWFWNRYCERFGRVPIDRFRSRAIAMRHTRDLVERMRETMVEFVMLPDGWMPHPDVFERDYVVIHHPTTRAEIIEAFLRPRIMPNVNAATTPETFKGPPVGATPRPPVANTLHAMAKDIGEVSVMLDGVDLGVFESTYEAFKQLNLPNTQHVRFRAKLKQLCAIGGGSGTALFEHDDKVYTFKVKGD